MPSSTSLLENEETESELSPLVLQTFVGIGLEDHGTQSQAEPLEPHRHTRSTSHFSLLDAVLELQPLPRHQLPAEECEEEVDERVPENTNTLLAQAPGLGSVMLPGMEGPETVILYSGGLDDSTPHQVPGMIILPSGYREAGFEVEQPSLMRRKSVNTTECVGVPSSEHVAEIVGRQGCKIKALRAKTNTYIKTPVRGEQPVFVVTGRKEDVAMAKREILSAAEHFSLIRASRNKAGSITGAGPGVPALPGQTTIQVRVPYRVVGLVVGPKGATIKRIQQQTHTYIVTPSRDKEPVFEVTGMPENVDRAREEIEAHIALRTGGTVETLPDEDDFHYNGTDVSFDAGGSGVPAQHINMATSQSGRGRGSGLERTSPSYRNNSSGSLGSGSSDSYYGAGGNRMADFSPTSPFGGTTGGGFCFGENLVPLATEDLPVPESTGGLEGQPVLWAALLESGCQDSQPATPRLSPTFHADLEHGQSHPMCTQKPTPRFSSYGPGFSSSGNSSASSSPDSASSWGPYPGRQDYVHCPEGEVIVPWHNDPFRTCQKGEPPSLVAPAPDVRLYNA